MAEWIKSGENPQAAGTVTYGIEGQAAAVTIDSAGNANFAGTVTGTIVSQPGPLTLPTTASPATPSAAHITVYSPDAESVNVIDHAAATHGLAQTANDLGGTSAAPTVVATHLAAPLPIAQGGTANANGMATGVLSATTSINTAAATAPTAGQVLTATNGTAATWVTPVTPVGSGNSSVRWFNVLNYGAKNDNTTDDTAAINAAVAAAVAAGGGTVYFPEGAGYKVSLPGLNIDTNITYRGDGMGSVINYVSTTGAAFVSHTGTVQQHISFYDLQIVYAGGAAGTGSANAIRLLSDVTLGSVPYCTFMNLKIFGFGSDGIYADGLIVSGFYNVICQNGGATGFKILQSRGGAFTSVGFHSCYALSNASHGYDLEQPTYCGFFACAADHNGGDAYHINNGQGVSLLGCGSEYNVSGETATANGFVFTGGSTTCEASSCWTYQQPASGNAFYVTGSSTQITFTSCRPNTVIAGANGFKLDAGSQAVYNNCASGGAPTALVGTYDTIAGTIGTRRGTAVLNGTTNVVVANTSVTANTRILLTVQTPGGTVGIPQVVSRVAGTSFTIVSSNAADTSTVAYILMEN